MTSFLIAGAVIGVIGYAAYLMLAYSAIPGFKQERLGELETPADLGVWKTDETSAAGKQALANGQKRQERLWLYPDRGLFGAGKLVRQVRYENVATSEIERIDPEETVKRRRVKS